METNKKHLTIMAGIGAEITLHEIDEVNREYFKPQDRLSDWQEWPLKLFGDMIAPKGAVTLWLDGAYMWFVDREQTQVQRVFQTDNGILVFDDIMHGKMYRCIIDNAWRMTTTKSVVKIK